MQKANIRTIVLVLSIFTFLLLGAAVFDALESDYEAEDLRRLRHTKHFFIQKYNFSREDFRNITWVVRQMIPHNTPKWKFTGAFYYSLTVITVIGYGHSTPRTALGKAFTIFYAFAGIPLCLVMLQSIGDRLNAFASFLLGNIKKCFRLEQVEVTTANLIVIDTGMAILVVLVSAAVFNYYENWGYLNAVYYCIITLTTVGFGDLVPLQTEADEVQRSPEYVAFTLFFIFFGMTVVSANMNLMVLHMLAVAWEDERKEEMKAAIASLLQQTDTCKDDDGLRNFSLIPLTLAGVKNDDDEEQMQKKKF